LLKGRERLEVPCRLSQKAECVLGDLECNPGSNDLSAEMTERLLSPPQSRERLHGFLCIKADVVAWGCAFQRTVGRRLLRKFFEWKRKFDAVVLRPLGKDRKKPEWGSRQGAAETPVLWHRVRARKLCQKRGIRKGDGVRKQTRPL